MEYRHIQFMVMPMRYVVSTFGADRASVTALLPAFAFCAHRARAAPASPVSEAGSLGAATRLS